MIIINNYQIKDKYKKCRNNYLTHLKRDKSIFKIIDIVSNLLVKSLIDNVLIVKNQYKENIEII